MRIGYTVAVAALALLGGCSNSKKSEGGLPPATAWNSNQGGVQMDLPEAPQGANPHGGGGEGGELANTGPNGEPLGPVDPNGPNPHAGVDMAGQQSEVSKLGLPPPDPNRPIDPTHHIAGVIKVDPKVADKVVGSRPIFLSVKRPDANGNPMGMPVAVQKMIWTQDGLAFELTDHDAMVGTGDSLSGDVVVIAHYDQDGDAITKQPGDVFGQVRVKIPADKVVLTLDTVMP